MGVLSPTAVNELKADHRKLQSIAAGHPRPGRRAADTPRNWEWARLTEALDAPENLGDVEEAAAFIQFDPGTDDSTSPIVIQNWDPGVSYESGGLIRVVPYGLAWIPAGGSGGGGGGGDCCCPCVCVEPNMIHPIGGFPTVRHWRVAFSNSSSWIPTVDGSGEVSLTSGQYTLVWDDAAGRWEGIVFSGSIQFRDDAGVLATPQSAGGTIIMDWENINGLFFVEFEFDATGGQNPIPI